MGGHFGVMEGVKGLSPHCGVLEEVGVGHLCLEVGAGAALQALELGLDGGVGDPHLESRNEGVPSRGTSKLGVTEVGNPWCSGEWQGLTQARAQRILEGMAWERPREVTAAVEGLPWNGLVLSVSSKGHGAGRMEEELGMTIRSFSDLLGGMETRHQKSFRTPSAWPRGSGRNP